MSMLNETEEALTFIFSHDAPPLHTLLSNEILHKFGLSPTNPLGELVKFFYCQIVSPWIFFDMRFLLVIFNNELG